MNLIQTAQDLAINAHESIGHLRKYTCDPYWYHCAEVADILAKVGCDEEVIAAGWLHDTLEDTDLTAKEIQDKCGAQVLNLVREVTDVSKPEDGNRAVRKAKDRNHVAKASSDGKTIKLADLISNTSSIVMYDPGFAKIYMQEKALLLTVLVQGNQELWYRAFRTLDTYLKTHGLER